MNQEQLIATYTRLMGNLQDLPNTVAELERTIAELQPTMREVVQDLERREAELILEVEGRNAEQRKANLELMKAKDTWYQRLSEDLAGRQVELSALQTDLEHWQRQYGAVCHQTRLHAAMLTYLGSAGAPVDHDIDFRMKTKNTVSAADAAAIGL